MVHQDLPGSDEALRLARDGKIHEALACCDRALASDPKNYHILNNKAMALISLGRYKESLECTQMAITINPCEAGVWINKGTALKKLGRLKEAADALEQAVAISPYNAYARALLGIVYQKLEMDDKADAQNRMLQEIVFPREYAGFFFATAAFLLGILLGGIMSVEGKPLPVTLGSAFVLLLFFCCIEGLYSRTLRLQMEAGLDVSTAPYPGTGQREQGKRGLFVMLGFLMVVFLAGILAGIEVWQNFR